MLKQRKTELFFVASAIMIAGCFSFSYFSVTKVEAQSSAPFYRNLAFGISGEDVRELQKLLNSEPETLVATVGPGSLGFETMFFGSATKSSVVRFQNKYRDEILTPLGLVVGTGFVGESTLKKLNQLYDILLIPPLSPFQSNTPRETQATSSLLFPTFSPILKPDTRTPKVTSISVIPMGEKHEIKINGTKFINPTSVHTIFGTFISTSTSPTSIRFFLEDISTGLDPSILEVFKKESALPLYVENTNGISNPNFFTLQ